MVPFAISLFGGADLKPFIVLGLAVGGLYATSAVAVVVLYRTTGVVFLAYGAVGALGALLSWELLNSVGIDQWLALAGGVTGAALITLAYGLVFGQVFAGRDSMIKALGTLALAVVLLGIMSAIWGQESHSLRLPTSSTTFEVFGVFVSLTQVIAMALGLALTIGVNIFLSQSRLGTAMRALANDREAAAMLGVPVRRVEAVAWLAAGVLSGLCGLMLADLYGLDYTQLTFLVIPFVAAALIGGLRSLWATLIAGILIGVVQSCLTASYDLQPYQQATPFVFAIIGLLWLGRRRVVSIGGISPLAAGASAAALDAAKRNPWVSRSVVAVGTVFLLTALPLMLSAYWTEVATSAVIYSVVALGTGLLMGRVGLVSLCQIALLAVGGWIAIRLGYATSLPFPVILLLAGIGTGGIGLLVGAPALRLSGLYLALITLMAAGAITTVLTKINFPNGAGGFTGYDATSGMNGALSRPSIAGSTDGFFRYALVVAALMFLVALWQVRGKAGRAWKSIRQSESAALAAGINTTIYKLWAFVFASFITGVMGGVLAASGGGLSATQFPTSDSLLLLMVVLMGGIYSFWGAAVAGILFKVLPAIFTQIGLDPQLSLILFGAGALQVMVTAPGGFATQMPKDVRRVWGLIRRLSGRSGSQPAGTGPSTGPVA